MKKKRRKLHHWGREIHCKLNRSLPSDGCKLSLSSQWLYYYGRGGDRPKVRERREWELEGSNVYFHLIPLYRPQRRPVSSCEIEQTARLVHALQISHSRMRERLRNRSQNSFRMGLRQGLARTYLVFWLVICKVQIDWMNNKTCSTYVRE